MSIKGDTTQEACVPVVTTGWLCLLMTVFLLGCQSSPKSQIRAPLPPEFDPEYTQIYHDKNHEIQSLSLKSGTKEKTSCSFSSAQRKNTLGYEWDESTHIALRVSPKIDIWDIKDFDVKTSIKFTHAFGGSANKRPCTYGSGYYGLLPYLTNNEGTLSRLTNPSAIKSMVQERMKEREKEKSESY